jgi:hypothetical protein
MVHPGFITASIVAITVLFGFIAYNAPPTIALSNDSISNSFKTDNDSVSISGQVSTLHNATLTINGQKIRLTSTGDFSYKLPLHKGDTDVILIAKSEKGVDKKSFRVHRTTDAEFAERQHIAAQRAAEKKRIAEEQAKKARADAINAMSVCDGKAVTSNCKLEGTIYKTYVYHLAVPEKTHTVTDTTYKEVVTGYCTLCNDGTRSPSCATGRGTCSWHGGVAQWNAPITSKMPVYNDRVVVDAPAVAEYYEKVLDAAYN